MYNPIYFSKLVELCKHDHSLDLKPLSFLIAAGPINRGLILTDSSACYAILLSRGTTSRSPCLERHHLEVKAHSVRPPLTPFLSPCNDDSTLCLCVHVRRAVLSPLCSTVVMKHHGQDTLRKKAFNSGLAYTFRGLVHGHHGREHW